VTFQKEMCKIFKIGAKGSILRHFLAPGPTRKLRDEVTSSPGRAKLAWASKLLQEESSSSPRRAAMQPPPLISYK